MILPLTVLRRVDSVLAATKPKVLAADAKYGKKLDDPHQILCKASGFAF